MIYINARFLTQDMTGVQRFAEQISRSLNGIRNDIVFLVPDEKFKIEIDPSFEIKVIENMVICGNKSISLNISKVLALRRYLTCAVLLPYSIGIK